MTAEIDKECVRDRGENIRVKHDRSKENQESKGKPEMEYQVGKPEMREQTKTRDGISSWKTGDEGMVMDGDLDGIKER